MKLADVVTVRAVWPTLMASAKQELMEELSAGIASILTPLSPQLIYDALCSREALGSTALEDGVAIPHAKLSHISQLFLGCGRKSEGIDFDAPDGKKTTLFFVVLVPSSAVANHLKVLARLSRLLKEERIRQRLLDAQGSQDMYDILVEEDERIAC